MIPSGDCVHARFNMKRLYWAFTPKSFRFNESCRWKVVGLKLLLTSSNFSGTVKQSCHSTICVGWDCAFRKSNIKWTLSLLLSVDVHTRFPTFESRTAIKSVHLNMLDFKLILFWIPFGTLSFYIVTFGECAWRWTFFLWGVKMIGFLEKLIAMSFMDSI